MDLPVLNRRIRRSRMAFGVLAALMSFCVFSSAAQGARVKDIATTKGVRSNPLIGYGLVVGLNGSGDKQGTEFTIQSLASMLARLGIGVDPEAIRVKNVAAVTVTAELPPFARTGASLDVLISSLGDATSLEGGTLLMTPLFGVDGEVYAIAQGAISVGGFAAGGGSGTSVQKNHPTVGRLPAGAIVERELGWSIAEKGVFDVALAQPDFTTARRAADAINRRFGQPVATTPDPGTVQVAVPETYAQDVVGFMAAVEAVEVDPDRQARVILNERTGTVVMGESVTISTVAVSHGSLSVTITANNQVSQPRPFSEGETREVRNQSVSAVEEAANLTIVRGPVTIDELVRGLNAMGVTPRDLIAILQAIRAAGALAADLELM